MSVDEVMKDIEMSVRPDKELVDNAIGKILKERVQRSVSAPSRMIIKAVDKMYESSEREGLFNNMPYNYNKRSYVSIFNDDNLN